MASTPPQNSLLSLLNPYAPSRSVYADDDADPPPDPTDPDSPSTLLLRELQGAPEPGASPLVHRGAQLAKVPVPTPASAPTHVLASRSASSSSDGEGGPSASMLYGSAERTPKSPPSGLPRRAAQAPSMSIGAASPGPFKPESPSRSRSTSPGQSTVSAFASSDANEADGYAGPSTSTSAARPTFREPVGGPRTARRQMHNDPPIEMVASTKGKTKGKGKHKYHAVSADAADDEEAEDPGRYAGLGVTGRRGDAKAGLDERERALWKWVNVDDLDGFLQEVYAYYKGKGIYCIVLVRVLNLLTTFFVIAFSTFLLACIDYHKLASSVAGPNAVGRLSDALIPQCITRGSFPHMLFILCVAGVYAFQLFTFALEVPRLIEMFKFYTYLLGIPDADIQTLPWPEIVRLVGEIRKHNPVTSLSNEQATTALDVMLVDKQAKAVTKLDAHDIANRILRQENYLIALFNKDLLDTRVRLPVPHALASYVPKSLLAPPTQRTLPQARQTTPERTFVSFGANTLTKALEWNLRFCLMGYLFDRRGQVRKEFVRERKRRDLVQGLQRRFAFMGVLNAIFAPFIVVYLLIYSFFRYFEEFHKNPSSIGGRQYTPYAQWKFREFNELPHLFERRLLMSYVDAKKYIDQFPKEKTAQVMRFVAFIAGSFAAVLLTASLIDPDLFLHFEVTPGRTVLFYLGICGSIVAMTRGGAEDPTVFDPEASLRNIVKYTHYLPGEWQGRLHSQMVYQEFGRLFALKITIFFQEVLAVLLTPFILWFSLPPCAESIIDFFREFTVHVDGVGYVCSFAVFDFRRHGIVGDAERDPTSQAAPAPAAVASGGLLEAPARSGSQDRRQRTGAGLGIGHANEHKMEKSFLHFKATHPDWQPDPSSSVFLDRLVGASERLQASMHAGVPGGALGLSRSPRMPHATPVLPYRRDRRAPLKSAPGAGQSGHAQGPPRSPRSQMQLVGVSEEDDEAEVLGWEGHVRVGAAGGDGGDGDGDEVLRDMGVVGLLQQVLNH
ncbi:autophagy protein atg9 [Cryptotrichosporon argae]